MRNLCLGIEKFIHNTSKYMAIVAALVLGGMMLITTADVFGRYFFNAPISGTWEIVGLLLTIGGTWGMAYCQRDKAHISVKVILDILPAKIQNIILCIGYLMGLVAFFIIAWRMFLSTKKYFLISGYTTDILHIPLFPFTFALALGAALTVFVLFVDFLTTLAKVFRK